MIEKVLMIIALIVIAIIWIVMTTSFIMNLLRYNKHGTCIYFHNWREYNYSPDTDERQKGLKKDLLGDVSVATRTCEKCLYKEKMMIGEKYNIYWVETTDYTTAEAREIGFRKLKI